MAERPVSTGEAGVTPVEGRGPGLRSTQEVARKGDWATYQFRSVQKLQVALHAKAKGAPGYRFYALYDKIYRQDILAHPRLGPVPGEQGRARGWTGKTLRTSRRTGGSDGWGNWRLRSEGRDVPSGPDPAGVYPARGPTNGKMLSVGYPDGQCGPPRYPTSLWDGPRPVTRFIP